MVNRLPEFVRIERPPPDREIRNSSYSNGKSLSVGLRPALTACLGASVGQPTEPWLATLLLALPAHRRKPLDPDQRCHPTVAKKWVMASRRISNIEVAAIATVVLSVVVLAVVLLSPW